MRKNSFNSKIVLSKKLLKRVVMVAIITIAIISLGNNQSKVLKDRILDEQEHVAGSQKYFTISLTGGTLPSTITEDTYLAKGTYTINSNLTVQAGVTLEVEAGTVINVISDNIINVNGILRLNGTETENIAINHSNGYLNSRFITVETTGTLESTYTNFQNNVSSPIVNVDVINNKGTLTLDNVKTAATASIYSNIVNSGNIETTNSNIAGIININQYSNDVTLNNNTLSQNILINNRPTGIISIKDNKTTASYLYPVSVTLDTADENTFVNITGNYNATNGSYSAIQLKGATTSNIKLTKQNYVLFNSITIPVNTVFEVDAGTILKIISDSIVNVNGTLMLNGTEAENININHSNGYLNSRFITVETTGTLESTYTNFQNGVSNPIVNVDIINNKGTLTLDNVKMAATASIYSNIVNSGNIQTTNSNIAGIININQYSNDVTLNNNTLSQNILINNGPTGIISIKDNKTTASYLFPVSVSLGTVDENTFVNITGNYNATNELYSTVQLKGTPTGNVKLTNQKYTLSDGVTIPVNTVFEVDAGTILKIGMDKLITVNGTLNLSGNLANSVSLTNTNGTTTTYWRGITIGSTGLVLASNVDIRQAGGSSNYPIENNGQLVMWNSIITNGYYSKGIRYNTTNPDQVLTNNSILGDVISNIAIQAYYNFWGNESGPRRRNPETGIYSGTGFTVSDNIVVEPFNTSFFKTDTDNFEFIKINELRHFGIQGINSFSGNYSKQFVDLGSANQNSGLTFERTYNSRSEDLGILGHGWAFSFSSKIIANPYKLDSYIAYLPDGSINIFDMQTNGTYSGINNRNIFEIINGKYILTKVDQTIYTYNNSGILESITDKYGNITNITTNANGNITNITDYANRQYLFEYNGNNLLTKITDPIGRTVTYTYNSNSLLETVTNVDGIITTYNYNTNNQLISIKENNIETETIEYFASGMYSGKVSKYTNEYGNVITYTYNQTSNFTTETDSNGNATKKYYDREGYIIKTINPDNTQTLMTYNTVGGTNKYGEELTDTDIYTHKTVYTRDTQGRITKIAYLDLGTKQYTYNSKNNIIKEIDELGNTTEYIYDSDGVTLLHVVKPLDGITPYSSTLNPNLFEITSYTYYDPIQVNGIKGLIETTTDDKGTTTYEYDAYGNKSKATDGALNATTYTTNKLGWTLTEQTNTNYITDYQYNNSGSVTRLAKDSNVVSLTEYNYQNKPSKITDGNGNFELMEYDKAGNVTKKTDKEGNITNYQYDLYGNVNKQINPNGAIYTYEYDKLNRLTKSYFKENEDSTPVLLIEKAYTNANNYTITTKTYTTPTEFKTKVETYNYRNKLVSEKNESVTKSKTYLKNGLVSYEIDGNGGYIYYFYTKTNHLDKKYVMTATNQYICTVYVYDNYGRLIEEKVGKTKVSSTTAVPTTFISTHYQYNNIGQVIKKTTSSGEEINYTYDEFGNVASESTKIDDNNNQIKEYKYNYLNKVTEDKNGPIIKNYEYDNVGNITKETTGENKVTTYVYNKNSKLTKTTIEGVIKNQLYYDSMNNIIKEIDGNGNITEKYYDKQNNLIEEKNPKSVSTYNSYDLNGRLTESKDPNNIVTTYTYDKFDNVIQKTVQNEAIYTYEYDNNNNLTKETDPLGYIITYTYDKTNKLTQKTDKLNYTIQYQYDTQFNKISEKNKKDQYTYYAYDERNNMISKTINNVVVEHNVYNLLNNVTKKTDGNGNETNYYYNNSGELIKKVNPLGYIEEYEYNNDGKLVTTTGNSDKQINYSYDNNGNIIEEAEQKVDGTQRIVTSKEYDNNNNLTKEIDGNGNITTHEYDGLNNRTKTINPLNQATIYAYDNNNNLVSETNYLGDSKTYSYDKYDRLIETKNELGQTIESLEYDLNGRQTKSTDALGNAITYVYDKNDNVIETKDQLSYSELKAYDALGNVTSKTDKNGNVTAYEYDINQNLTKVTNALSEITTYLYDNNNNLTKVTDARGKIVEQTYDGLNNELTEKDGLGNIEYKEYYPNGSLKKKTTRNGDIINYTYDVHDRLVSENNITYAYDNNNNLTSTTDSNNQTTRVYDALNRVTSKTENGLTSTFTYDIDGYKEKTIDPLQNETIKEYDKAGRLIKVNNDVEYLYNSNGTLQKLTYANGATEEYFYNADKTLNKVTNTHGTTVEEHTYTYDNNKNIIQEVTPTNTIVNTYDTLNRLKTVTKNGVVTTYSYDQSGNRSQEVTGSITKDYVYDSKNKLSQVTEKDNGIVTKTTTYGYDLNGNLLTTTENGIIVETNVFNDRNELTSTTKNNTITTYDYNVEGKRISKSDGTDTTKFVYDGTQIILEVDGSNNELSRNTYGLALISRTSGSNSGYYLHNGHGDVVLIVDALNQTLNTYEYDAFGNITNETETLDNPYKYAGYYYDSETGNYYLMSRYYNPAIARFISEDTYRGDSNDPLSLNRYVYVNNNPMIYDDPNGNVPIPVITGIIGGIFGGGTTFVQDWLDDGKINTDLKVYAGNIAQGAITGAALGFGINPFVSGFAGGTLGDVTNQLITTGQVDVAQSLVSGATTAITSGVFSLGGQVTSTGLNYVKDYAAKGFLAGMVGDSTYQILNGGIVRDEYGKAAGYNLSNAIQGYNPVQALKSGVAGAIMAPIGAKIVETAIDKWGPYSKFDLNDPESFRDANIKNVEKYLDQQLDGKNGYEKSLINKGTGVKYLNGKGGSYRLNNGYAKAITNGSDGMHTSPYLTTTVGSEVIRIPLK